MAKANTLHIKTVFFPTLEAILCSTLSHCYQEVKLGQGIAVRSSSQAKLTPMSQCLGNQGNVFIYLLNCAELVQCFAKILENGNIYHSAWTKPTANRLVCA